MSPGVILHFLLLLLLLLLLHLGIIMRRNQDITQSIQFLLCEAQLVSDLPLVLVGPFEVGQSLTDHDLWVGGWVGGRVGGLGQPLAFFL